MCCVLYSNISFFGLHGPPLLRKLLKRRQGQQRRQVKRYSRSRSEKGHSEACFSSLSSKSAGLRPLPAPFRDALVLYSGNSLLPSQGMNDYYCYYYLLWIGQGTSGRPSCPILQLLLHRTLQHSPKKKNKVISKARGRENTKKIDNAE